MPTPESIAAMHRVFREQHRQMIEEQKKLLKDYQEYFDGVLQQMAEFDNTEKLVPASSDKEDDAKEIAEIGALLNEAIKTYGKELAEILVQLTERQRKKAEEEEEHDKDGDKEEINIDV